MGLNDGFILDDTTETPPTTVKVDALKNTTPGQEPELRDDVDLIAMNEEGEKDERKTQEMIVAVEELAIRYRDLEILQQSLKTYKGMSQQIALECRVILPDFIGDVRPMGSFTKQVTQTNYTAALEEVAAEKKGVLQRMVDFISRIITKVLEFINKIIGRKSSAERKRERDDLEQNNADIEKELAKQKDADSKDAVVDAATAFEEELRASYNPKTAQMIVFCGASTFNSDAMKIAEYASKKSVMRMLRIEQDDSQWHKEKDTILQLCSDYEKSLASMNWENTDCIDMIVKSITKYNHSVFGKPMYTSRLVMAELEIKGLQKDLQYLKNSLHSLQDADKAKVISQTISAIQQYIHILSSLVLFYDCYVDLGRRYGEKLKRALKMTGGVTSAREEISTDSGFIAAAGSDIPTPAGFAEYYISSPMADALTGSLNGAGDVTVGTRESLVARIRTLQEALARLDNAEAPALEAIDLLTQKMRPMQALAFTTIAERGDVDKALFTKALSEGVEKLRVKNAAHAQALTSDIQGARMDLDSAKKFNFFSKAPSREVTDADIESFMKISNGPTSAYIAFFGQPDTAKRTKKFLSEVQSVFKTDIFSSNLFWANVRDSERMRKELWGEIDKEYIDDHKLAATVAVSGILGHVKDFFSDHESISNLCGRLYDDMEWFIEKNLNRYIAVASDKGYEKDEAYFNEVLEVYRIIMSQVLFVGRVYYTYGAVKKEFLSAA